MTDEPSSGAVACPRCGGANVRILDKGVLKCMVRLFLGTSRYCCRDCRITWRENHPESASKMRKSTKSKLLSFCNQGEWRVIVLPEEGWHRNLRELEKTIDHLLAMGARQIMLDMSRPQMVSSASFGMLLKFHKRCKEQGGQFQICGASAPIREAIHLTSLGFLLAEETR